MLKIAINTRLLLPGTLEGVGYYVQELCRRLPELMPEARFLFCFDRPFDPRLVAHPRVTGRVILPPARHPLLWNIWFDYRIPRVLREWGADVFFSPDGHCSLRTGVRQVMVTHDIAFMHYRSHLPGRVQQYYESRVPRFLAQAERIVTVSDFVRQDLHRTFGVPLAKVSVAGNGVKGVFRVLTEGEITAVRGRYAGGVPYFFYLGAVHPRKNIARLIAAYTLFRRRGGREIALLIGGRLAWQNESVKKAYAESAYGRDIHFLDYLPETEVAQVLGGALALVYPSLSEGFGVPLLESMQAGVPVLCSQSSSLPEVAGPAALYFEPHSVEDIALAMGSIVTDDGLRKRLVAQGHRRRHDFDWRLTAEKVASILGGG